MWHLLTVKPRSLRTLAELSAPPDLVGILFLNCRPDTTTPLETLPPALQKLNTWSSNLNASPLLHRVAHPTL
jgi:hypothetical protein